MLPVTKVQNPLTGRWIARDGRVHRRLQQQGSLVSEPPLHALAMRAHEDSTSGSTGRSIHLPVSILQRGDHPPGPENRNLSAHTSHTPPQDEQEEELKGNVVSSKPTETESELLPRMIAFTNEDKGFHEAWYPRRDLLDIPHPFRMVLLSKPNGGKTTIILNIIARISLTARPFERIVIVHCDPSATREYDDVPHDSLTSVPGANEFDPKQKTLLILEDLNYLDMSTEQRGKLERVFGYVSTHKNVSVMLTAQDPFRLLPTVRRCSNVFVMWNNHDGDMIQALARKCGVDPSKLLKLFHQHCQGPHNSIWLDMTPGTPAPLRKNGFQILTL